MPVLSFRPLLHSLNQSLAIVALFAAMALMAFAAGLTLLVGMIVCPLAMGLAAVRQHLRGCSATVAADSVSPAARLTRP